MGVKLREEKTTTRGTLANNLFILKLAWGIHPQRIIAEFSKKALDQFANVFFSVIFVKYLIESISSDENFQHMLYFVVGSMIVFMLISLFSKWYEERFLPLSNLEIYEHLYLLLFRKASDVDLSCYEDTEFYNKYTMAMKEADTRVSSVLDNMSSILFSVIATISIFSVMFSIDHWVLLFILAPIIGNFVFGNLLNKTVYKRKSESVKYQRRMDYVNRVLYMQNYAKEIRLSNIYHVLKMTYEQGFDGVIRKIHKYRVRGAIFFFWQNYFTYTIIFEGVLLYGAYQAIVGHSISIGSFAVLASAMVSGSHSLIRLSGKLMSINENGIFIENLHQFLNVKSEIPNNNDGLKPHVPIQMIEFDQVSFAYRGSDQMSADRFSLRIHRNEKIALVGHNGAGKTTLIKLLMRLYDPTAGEIRVNGIDIKQYAVKEYRALFGTAFQDFQVFSMTIAENVLMRDVKSDMDREIVIHALQKSGIYDKVQSLSQGIDTILTREFTADGVVLSGGELQKIAIARAFAKDTEIVILDEPSSALDPIAEYQVYESMMEVCKDKTVIFISHRLSSALLADRIYMIEEGRIVEEGTHMELMLQGGKYATLFRKQAEKYVEEENLQMEVLTDA